MDKAISGHAPKIRSTPREMFRFFGNVPTSLGSSLDCRCVHQGSGDSMSAISSRSGKTTPESSLATSWSILE